MVEAKKEEAATPPPFFLQDPTDSLCLGGSEFKRCSIDTLWYVTGSAGEYQIHKRSLDGSIETQDDGLCLAKKSCKDGDKNKQLDTKVTKCSNCGAKGWNIMGDSESGYILTIDDGKNCLSRIPNQKKDGDDTSHDRAITSPCDDAQHPYTALQLQFASAADITTMSSPGARLVAAATDGDKKAVQAVLKEDGVDINVVDWDGLNALIPAASSGHLDLCKFLIKEGIDVNAADKDGITALMEASIMGHGKIVEFLLDSGATLEQTANSGITALWLAASDGKDEIVKLLLEKGADATNTRVDDISALMTAAVGGHAAVVETLLANGADAASTDKEGLTPLMNAAEKGDAKVIQSLLTSIPEDERADHVNLMSTTGFNALIIACAHGNTEAVSILLDYGADVAASHADSGVTALMYAAANQKNEVVKLLLEKGQASVDQTHLGGGTALLEAATGGAVEAMQILMDAGANFDHKDDDGVSPVMGIASQCVLEGQKLVVEALQKAGKWDAELDRMSFSGGTPIMFAAAGGHTECVNHFVELGAFVDARSKATPEYLAKMEKAVEAGTTPPDQERHVDDVTALHVAAQGGHLACVQALLAAGADPLLVDAEGRSALTMAIKGNYGEVAVALVKAGADPNIVYLDEESKTEHNLLFDSIMVENEEFALALIEKGADIYHVDDKKVTTLLQASHRGLTDVVAKLIEAHAANGGAAKSTTFLDDGSEEGVTPLVAASSEGHDAVVDLLIKAGASVNVNDADGTTALMAAAARGHLPIVRALVAAGGNVNSQNADGHSALMFAYNGKTQVETLMERYAQYVEDEKDAPATEDKDDGGTGPLIKEALANHTALVDFLLSNGADATLKDKEGHTAKDFDYAAEHPAVFQKGSVSGAADSAKEEL
eukprot:CAMPEP_0172440294 /NCGR_PEP_ID=MMETSP1065-20121228/964_1 /TAXON_ID=265537 /ORGANISM="Amphiprora paludosa, Strain CCMP125" /LENGTH=892 /DNA_ID=CAMNT_0013189081 /DNA_START=48 /DNA_END=2726 /DNA_ORIENTATION=-